MLLKSWAIPPASTPRLSSFWAWNICSSMTRRCRSACRSAVTSSPTAWTATGGPPGSPTAVSVHLCHFSRPPGASDLDRDRRQAGDQTSRWPGSTGRGPPGRGRRRRTGPGPPRPSRARPCKYVWLANATAPAGVSRQIIAGLSSTSDRYVASPARSRASARSRPAATPAITSATAVSPPTYAQSMTSPDARPLGRTARRRPPSPTRPPPPAPPRTPTPPTPRTGRPPRP